MKKIILTCAAAWFAFGPSDAVAAAVCADLRVKDSVQVTGSELTLADLLSADACAPVRAMAAGITLGSAPLTGSRRVLERLQVQAWLEDLASASGLKQEAVENVPVRIVVRRGGAKKSCAAIADLARRSLLQAGDLKLENLNCAAAQSVPDSARLELTKSAWNPALQRWEFSLRCTRTEDCVPFLVWAPAITNAGTYHSESAVLNLSSPSKSSAADGANQRLIKAGQTATLRWDQGGICVVLPVICLDGGALGQTVRVQIRNAGRILRAQILSDGTLRAGL
jgi:Chaperone for flagella basal body P-ring formation